MAGRKTKKTDDLVAKAQQYVNGAPRDGERQQLPTIERLSLVLGLSRETLYQWGKTEPFSDILEKLQARQADQLIRNGLSGKYNGTITKLMPSKHGYVERQELDHTTKGQPMPLLGGTTPLLDDDGLQADNQPSKDSAAS